MLRYCGRAFGFRLDLDLDLDLNWLILTVIRHPTLAEAVTSNLPLASVLKGDKDLREALKATPRVSVECIE